MKSSCAALQRFDIGRDDRGGAEDRHLPRIPGFRMIELCGRGGSGSVYLGIDRDGVRRAVRVIRDGEGGEGRLARESCAVALYRNLAHGNEHLIDILYSGRVRSAVYCIMPLADSASERQFRYRPLTLAEKLRRGIGSPEEQLRIVRDIVDAVSFLHAPGVAHRDLKPENILFIDGVLKVADPGMLASAYCRSAGGTREFSPPHPRSGVRTDIYAVGMMIYCVFTGSPPERFPELPPDWNSDFHSRLNRIILNCCAPEGGYADVTELAADLEGLSVPPPRRSSLRRAWLRTRRSAELWLVMLALLIGLGACHRGEHGAPAPRYPVPVRAMAGGSK